MRKYTTLTTILALALLFQACEFTYKLKNGEEAFDVKRYAVAVEMLQQEYAEAPGIEQRARKAFLIGQSYEMMGNNEDAYTWYRQAIEDDFGVPALEKYAEVCKKLQLYDEAIDIYQRLMQSDGQTLKYRRQMIACQQAAQWLEQSDRSAYLVEHAGFNSAAADYAPYVLGPEMVIFTSDRSQKTSEQVYEWTGRSYSDLFVVNTGANSVQPFDPTINSEHNEGTISFTSDKSQVFFSRCFDDGGYDRFCKLMMCEKRGATWSVPETLPFVKENVNYGHPVIGRKDSILIFSSNDPEGIGGYDLYYSIRTENGWSDPVIMSDRINTPGHEQYPSLHHDTLYFSSDYHPGMGGLDIFKTYLLPDGNWAPPVNLKPPVNSGWDDFGFVVDT
ncbi:MAG: tetratricopeptide repeat protein, partial [Saprospiraceae bacterium]|nr:tetratricopeptide repeat protein [Saprospiraceae bacterium]